MHIDSEILILDSAHGLGFQILSLKSPHYMNGNVLIGHSNLSDRTLSLSKCLMMNFAPFNKCIFGPI